MRLSNLIPYVFGLVLAASSTHAEPVKAARLLVADPPSQRLLIYNLPRGDLAADLSGVTLGAHVGVVTLSDGRVLIGDDKAQSLLVLDAKPENPQIAARIAMPITTNGRYGWAAVSPDERYYLVSSDDHEAAVETLTIVDIKGQKVVKTFKIDTGGPDEELGVAVGGEPALVVLHLSERVETYALADLLEADDTGSGILEGRVKPLSASVVAAGSHGDSVSTKAGKWTGSTRAGMVIGDLSQDGLKNVATIPWEIDGRAGGQNYRQRLTMDGRHVLGPVTTPPAKPENWAAADVDLHVVDLTDGKARRLPLAKGLVGRGGVSPALAAYASIEATGDWLNLVTIDPSSADFGKVEKIALQKLSNGPVPGQSAKDSNGRIATITPDGTLAFATHGGDGTISVIDTARKEVVATIQTPAPLMGTGYIVAIEPGARLSDFSAR